MNLQFSTLIFSCFFASFSLSLAALWTLWSSARLLPAKSTKTRPAPMRNSIVSSLIICSRITVTSLKNAPTSVSIYANLSSATPSMISTWESRSCRTLRIISAMMRWCMHAKLIWLDRNKNSTNSGSMFSCITHSLVLLILRLMWECIHWTYSIASPSTILRASWISLRKYCFFAKLTNIGRLKHNA